MSCRCGRCSRENFTTDNEMDDNELFNIFYLVSITNDYLQVKEYEKYDVIAESYNLSNVLNNEDAYLDLRCLTNSLELFGESNNTDVITLDELKNLMDKCITNMMYDTFQNVNLFKNFDLLKNIDVDIKIYIIILLIILIMYVKQCY
jgi:hypothetical protein